MNNGKFYEVEVLGKMELTIVKNTVAIDSDRNRKDSDVIILSGEEELKTVRRAIDKALQAEK